MHGARVLCYIWQKYVWMFLKSTLRTTSSDHLVLTCTSYLMAFLFNYLRRVDLVYSLLSLLRKEMFCTHENTIDIVIWVAITLFASRCTPTLKILPCQCMGTPWCQPEEETQETPALSFDSQVLRNRCWNPNDCSGLTYSASFNSLSNNCNPLETLCSLHYTS